jgi:hypothetical protein
MRRQAAGTLSRVANSSQTSLLLRRSLVQLSQFQKNQLLSPRLGAGATARFGVVVQSLQQVRGLTQLTCDKGRNGFARLRSAVQRVCGHGLQPNFTLSWS